MKYRNLTSLEIIELQKQDCRSVGAWDKIFVTDDFSSVNIKSTTFSGTNYLGLYSDKIELPHGAIDTCGIYNAHIHNCTISNQVFIKNIGTSISNYIISENVIIQNTNTLCVEGESEFGNGTIVCPVNEGGGRDVIIYNQLSAHTAYLMTFYREKESLIKALSDLAKNESLKTKSNKGIIGSNSVILNSGCIKNINIGSFATIEEVSYLHDGTINSSKSAPSYVGPQVNAAHFIFSNGATVSDGANIRHCFIGEGCEISKYFTAENSLFFANSQCLQGEACSIFAGPYTVTHHKSTLLIAGYYSFFNAGSGTNQSNHMYKLGPIHQGIVERGGKTGSNSYILWPAKIGAFTLVLGRHYGNPDISDLPFSYLIEDNGKSTLMPAQNIFNVGTTRDTEKWAKRDKRKGDNFLDFIITDALNPYTIEKIIKGINILTQLQQKASPQGKSLMFKNAQISLASINRGIKLYEQALVKYVGDELIYILKHTNFDSLRNTYLSETTNQKWVDLAGLICREDKLEILYKLLSPSNKLDCSITNTFFKEQFKNYNTLKTEHAFFVLKEYFKIDIRKCLPSEIKKFIKEWIINNDKIKSSIIIDAKKEFGVKSKISFGIDGDDTIKDHDFEAVRGAMASNSFINIIEQEFNIANKNAESIANTIT